MVSELIPRIVPIEDPDTADDEPKTIRVTPPSGSRQVRAFARLAAVVDRVPTTEVPTSDASPADAGILVHARPPEPKGPRSRLRHEALDALAKAEGDHEAALEQSRQCWQTVHEAEEQVEQVTAEEAAALRAFELIRESRRSAERLLRQARVEGELANQRCRITSRLLDGARIRAERI